MTPLRSQPVPAPPAPEAVAEALRAHLFRVMPRLCGRFSEGVVTEQWTGARGLVDVRQAAPAIVLLPAPPWSEPTLRFLVRVEVAERLAQAAAVLPSDVRLGFWEGLRPVAVQRALWAAGLDFLASSGRRAEGADPETILERFVARPEDGMPPHSTGGAVDVAAVDAFGAVLNPNDSWGRLGTTVLAHALRQVGMASYEHEWWHWSYGDAEWARAYDCSPLAFPAAPEFDGPGGGI